MNWKYLTEIIMPSFFLFRFDCTHITQLGKCKSFEDIYIQKAEKDFVDVYNSRLGL